MIIAFFGPDGSGKTTLAKMLMNYLLSKGIKASYIKFKSHHLAMYLILYFLRKLKVIPDTNSPRILDLSLKWYFNRSKLFICLELINAIIWLFVNIKLRILARKRVIIADRYVPDFIVSMLLIAPNKSVLSRLVKMLKSFTLNTIMIFLCVSDVDAMNRKRNEMLSHRYIKALQRLYVHVAVTMGIDLYLNTTKYDTTESFQLITRSISSRM